MADFTTTLPDAHILVSQRTLKSLLETCRQDQFTGLLRLRYPSGVDLVATFLDGAQQELYSCLNQKMEVIPRQSWTYSMDRPDASIASLSLPVEALRLARIVHEVPVLQMGQQQTTPGELMDHLRQWVEGASPLILHVQTKTAAKVYLIAGHSTPIIEELTMDGGEGRFSITDAAFPNSLAEAEYQTAWYTGDCNHDLWQEYELRYAFSPLMRMVLNRFSQLAGRILTERLCEQLSAWLQDNGWHIGLTINGVSNRHYFETFQQSRGTYLEIMRRFNDESSQAIGLRMAEGLWWETLLKMDPYRRDLLKRHFYNQDGLDHAGSARRYGS